MEAPLKRPRPGREQDSVFSPILSLRPTGYGRQLPMPPPDPSTDPVCMLPCPPEAGGQSGIVPSPAPIPSRIPRKTHPKEVHHAGPF